MKVLIHMSHKRNNKTKKHKLYTNRKNVTKKYYFNLLTQLAFKVNLKKK